MSSPTDDEDRPAGYLDIFGVDRVRLSEEDALAELRDDLLRASYQPGTVQLDSGVVQPYFFDKYLMFSRPAILRRLSRFLAASVPSEIDRLAAPTLGAVALGTAVSLETGLPLVIVRTQWDDGRRGQAVEGGLHQGERVVLIEDVVVTGSRALGAVQRLRDVGAQVTDVVAAVDCEHGAAQRFRAAGLGYRPLFPYSAFVRAREIS